MVQNKLLIKQFQKFIVFVSAKLVNRVTYLDITWLPQVANFGFYLNIFVNNRMKLFLDNHHYTVYKSWTIYIYIYIYIQLIWSYYHKKFYVHKIFIILSQQILSGSLLLVVMGEQKRNLSCRFKLELITTYYL